MDSIFYEIARVIGGNSWLAFPASFAGGLLSSAGPCSLAMIPLVIGYVGGYAAGSPRKALGYTGLFVLGLTVTFTAMGVAAGMLGTLFGDIGMIWRYIIPVLAIVVGLQLVGVIKFNPQVSERFLPRKRAAWGALGMGLIFGLVASPCATPILAVILMLGVSGADPVFSGGLLLSYAIGHWALVMVAGISVSSAQRLLESPRWARAYDWTRKAAGGLLIATGLYLIFSLFIS